MRNCFFAAEMLRLVSKLVIEAAGLALVFCLIIATSLSVVDLVSAFPSVSSLSFLLRVGDIGLMWLLLSQTDDHGSFQRAVFSFLRFLLLLGILQI